MSTKIYLAIITLLLLCSSISGQDANRMRISGVVSDGTGPMIGVSVFVKNEPGVGVITDMDGKFTINVNKNSVLVFTLIGYEKVEYLVQKSVSDLKITVKESTQKLDEVVVVGMGEQRKVSVVGAITNVDVAKLNVPSNSVSNMLGGNVPGIISVMRTGEPGKDNSEFWVRGISTFGTNASALVLIDGVEGDMNSIDPSDIKTFSVLKDAAATAVYGMRGANGVVIITTQRGDAGKLNVNIKSSATLSYSPRMPDYVNAYEYGKLANEAREVRDMKPLYDDIELNIFKNHLDPDLYPDVDWQKEVLKNFTWNQQNYLSVSGGGDVVRYFISAGMQSKSAITNNESMNKYNTSQNWRMYTWRANIDANVTKTTRISLMSDGSIQSFNYPGYASNSDAIWQSIASLSPGTVPLRFSNGLFPGYGDSGNLISPYVILNETGFRSDESTGIKVALQLTQDLKFITKGLSVSALYSFSQNTGNSTQRYKIPALYNAIGRNSDGSLIMEKRVNQSMIGFAKTTSQDRLYYFEANASYNRLFGEHRVGGLINYYMDDNQNSINNGSNFDAIAHRRLAVAMRATYSFKDTYFLEFNGGYTGSENFAPGSQFGFFPAIAGGWVPTQYDSFRRALPWLSFLKLRASYGIVGNDQLAKRRFPYFTNIGAVNGRWGDSAIGETQVGVDNLQWEKAKKLNLGLDFKLFNDKVDVTLNYFNDMRDAIYQERFTMPAEVGTVQFPFTNVGRVRNRGVDGVFAYSTKIGSDMSVTARGNFTYAANKAIRYEQTEPRYGYQDQTGKTLNIQRGLIALGLFRDELDILSSPYQTYGEVRPGDIKYRDVNGDGKVDDDDVVPLSYSATPQIMYGFALEYNWKKWTLSAWFKGASKSQYFLGGMGYYPFVNSEVGNVLSIVADQSNRWTPASYSGDPSTENPNARFPRLTYGNNTNNNRNSTFWLADGKYLKLQNIQLSYRLEARPLQYIGIQRCDITAIGENLISWDKVKLWDPEQASSNGAVYPLQRRFTIQLNVVF